MSLDLNQLAKDMLNAALPILKDKAPSIASFAEGEFAKIAQSMATIEKEAQANQITQEQAQLLFDMQKSATRSVLLTAEGLSLLAVEGAINAALNAVKVPVNAAIGFALI